MVENNSVGTIFNIQPFSIHDGPGLRTTLFLKGCPLHCPWCSNPESILAAIQVKLSLEKCQQCGICVETCAENALTLDENQKPRLDISCCNQCLKCVESCPSGCISTIGRKTTADTVVSELLKDAPFYSNTGGGVTLSGGEPLAQPDFTAAVLAMLKREGIHTAVDTTGFGLQGHLDAVLPHTDLVLFDIKHLDYERHRQVVGVPNDRILENLKIVADQTGFWIRVPLIPGFNDDIELADRIVALGKSTGAERVCFMPVHRWGEHKYPCLGMPNTLAGIPGFPAKRSQAFQDHFRHMSDYVFITGS